jgi:hypothetical protein
MTKEQIDSLSPEEKRVKIAELCGWKWEMVPSDEEMKAAREGTGKYEGAKGYPIGGGPLGGLQYRWWTSPGGVRATPPDYLNSADAIKAAILQVITEKVQQSNFAENLTQIINRKLDGQHRFLGATPFHVATAEPDDLCSAFLMTVL